MDRRRIARDRRGAGIAEYALLLFLVVAAVGITFRFMGGSVKRAGDKTQEQFQGGGGSGQGGKAGQGGAAGAGSAGGAGTAGAAGTAAGGGGGNTTGAGGGGGGASGGSGKASHGGGPSRGGDDDASDAEGTPIWKIIGGVVIFLFLIAGYFAFRKQKGSG